jgi:hypothetical protein
MLEVSIVDPKVGKSSWISIINCHHGGGGRGSGRGSPIASGCTAEVTDDNSQRADCVKYWFHNRRLSSPYNLDRFFPFARLPAGNFSPSRSGQNEGYSATGDVAFHHAGMACKSGE